MKGNRAKALKLKPIKYPAGLNQSEKAIYDTFYDSVESDLRSVGKRSK